MTTVLFICVHNSGRSQMAEAFFNELAKGQAQAISAGSDPANEVNPVVVEAMREVGIDISAKKPRLLTPQIATNIDKAVTMGCEQACPYVDAQIIEWQLEDPEGKSLEQVRAIRDEIKTKVAALVEEITR